MKKDKKKEQEKPKASWSITRIRKFFGIMGINTFAALFKSTQRCKTKKCKKKAIPGIQYCEKHKQTVPDDIVLEQFVKVKKQIEDANVMQARKLRSNEERQILEHNRLLLFRRYRRYLKKCLYFVERAQVRRNRVKVAHHNAEVKRIKVILYGDIATVAK